MNEINNINVEELLDSLTNLGIKFNLNDGNLIINAPKGIINDELREKISNNKPLIIKYLEKNILSNIDDSSIKKIDRDKKIPLSYSQQRLWFLYLLNPKTSIYNIPAIFSIKGSLDINFMEKAVNDIIKRHESLRTNFYFEDTQSYQKVSSELKLKLEVKNIDSYEDSKSYIDNKINETFDLTNDVLIRVELLNIKETNEYIFILVIHHIISDAWSCGVFANELSELYNSYIEKRESSLKQLDIQYIDYSHWQKEELNKEESKKQLDFWKEKLNNSNTNLSFPLDKKRPNTQTFNGNTINKKISDELKESLKELAKNNSTTMFVVLMSAFHSLLYKYTGEEDINVGFPTSGRNNKKIENMIGFFVNTLIIRSNINKEITFSDLLKQINQTTIDALSNQDIPFEKIVESLNVDRNTAYTPLFQFMFVMQNIEFKAPEFKDLEFKLIDNDNKTSKFDLTLSIKDNNSTLSIEYRTDLFEKETIERFLNHYENLLESIVKNPNEKISKLSILKVDEINDLINKFKAKQNFSTNNLLIHQLVENEAEKNPDKIALSFENEQISYSELNKKSNQLANYLIKNGVVHNSKIAVCIDISIDMIVSLIAILKTGSCYIPIDIEIPRERLIFILDDCNPSFVITKDEYTNLFNENSKLINLNEIDLSNELIENPNLNISENSYAYIIYTSGSTGKPNGVIISHKNVIRLFKSANNVFKFDNNDTWVLFHSYTFDYSVWEIWGTFYCGAKLLIVSKNLTRNPELFYKEICEKKVTILNQTPSAFQNFSKQAIKSNEKNYLKYIVISGENLDIQTLKDWYSTFPDNSPKLFNCYGITETTVFVTTLELNKNLLGSVSRSPIGLALNDLDLFILDENKIPVPLGVAGELYIGGAGVAISYLNRDELNKERFLYNIENIELNSKIYKSGDKVRVLNNGTLEFLGRLDKQVKIRGFRIELGEIESILNSYEIINESLVLLEENNNDKYLNAYITTKDNIDIDIQEIKIFLKSKVNNVMIPRNIIKLDSFPLNNNGKIDKKSLPKPNNELTSEKNIIIPENETQKILLNILRELLDIENIGINDNFFDIGAHSLLMIEAHNKIQEKLNINFELIELFNYPSIKRFSEFLSGKKEKKTIKEFYKKTDVDDIAIIGMAGKFPDAEDIDEFWKNIENGLESVHFFTDEELKNKGISQELINNPNYVKANCLIKDIEFFDADFWGYSPREAEILDPQQRLFLDCAYHALEHSGYNPDSIKEPVSIFAGTGLSRYMFFNLANNQNIIDKVGYFQLMIANDKDYLSTRASYKLNLKGSSVSLQTACSTSLVAVHSACQSLLNGESYMALAGGVSIDTQQAGYLYQEGSIASPDGHCRAFSDDAKGIIGGSGLGVVVLKRLKDAIKDNDSIYAVIKSTAINNDGSDKIGFLAPSVSGESDVIIEAIEKAGIKPQDIGYIETHGTGTPLGDPIEISALNKAFELYLDKDEHTNIAIGSVKTNIGHLDTASGIAGLIKTIQSLRYKKIPASLNFNKKNININFNSNMYVNTELKDWKSDSVRYAGVSSFGVGGTNAHAILSEYKENDLKDIKNTESNKLFIFSAKSKISLENMISNFKDYLNDNKEINLDNTSYTLKVGRKEFNNRYSFVADNIENAIKELDNFRDIENKKINKIVFMFSGVGSQYFKMSHNLYKNESVFKENIDKCSDILKPLVDLDIKDIIYNQESQEFINTSKFMPLCLFAVEYSLAKLWLSKGIKPDILIGHSFGEYVASCIAESISLEDSLKLILNRSSLFEKIKGSMIAVSTSKENLEKYLKNDLSISAVNGENLFLVSGSVESIKQLQLDLKENKIASTILEVSAPTHSELLKPIMEDFKPILDDIKWNKPNIPIISNLTSDVVDEYNADYWLNHMIKPVKFFDSINKLGTEDNILLIEIGAGNQLTSIIKRQNKKNLITINSLPIKNSIEDDHRFFLNSLGKIWQYGIKIDWSKENKYKRIALPLYPFNKKRYWVDSDSLIQNSANDFNKWFYIPSWKRIYQKNNYIENKNKYLLITNNQDFYNQISSNISKISLATNNFSIKSDDNNIYYIAKDDTYNDLFRELDQNNDLQDNIILDITDSQFFSDNYFKGDVFENFDNIINLVKELNNYNKKFNITIVVNELHKITGSERINPHKSLIIGPSKVINQEYKNITCKIIDIDKDSSVKNIFNELNSHDSLISYRNNYKWEQKFDKVKLDKEHKNNYLKEKGTYLITGGLGGIGLSIAEFLSKDYQANLILINRFTDPLDDLSLSSKLVELENLGSEIILKKANVINYSTLEKAFIEALDKFERIDGIIHTAGLASDKLIHQRNTDDNSVLDTKIQATKNLARLAEKFNCDFLFLCSSLNSLLGGVGQVEYTSANAFLDSFSELYQNSELKVISTNWGAWKNVGMAEKNNKNLPESLKNSNESMTVEEGIEVFKLIMNSELSQVIVSPIELDKLKEKYEDLSISKGKQLIEKISSSKKVNLYSRPELNNQYLAPETELEKTICEIWQETLGIEKVGVTDNFFELGGDSLNLASIKLKIENKLNIELPMNIIFQGSTIKDLVKFLDSYLSKDIKEIKEDRVLIEENNNVIDTNEQDEKLIVALKTTGNKTPFFCVHAISGTSFPFTDLAKNFEKDHPFYAIQAQGLSSNKIPINNLKEMASLYIKEIKKIQSQGSYIIGGWSFGAIVALEIAQQLKSNGDNVEKLIIIDMQAPSLDESENLSQMELKQDDLKEIFFNDMKKLFGDNVDIENPDIARLFKIFQSNIQASKTYIANNYSGKVELFKASEGIFKETGANYLRWSEISESVNIYNIKGDHYTILKSEEFFNKLNSIIDL
ncbi:MAG: amino acid adenylation domain-containing protein [Candidatus Sericytochromatia bacterium]